MPGTMSSCQLQSMKAGRAHLKTRGRRQLSPSTVLRMAEVTGLVTAVVMKDGWGVGAAGGAQMPPPVSVAQKGSTPNSRMQSGTTRPCMPPGMSARQRHMWSAKRMLLWPIWALSLIHVSSHNSCCLQLADCQCRSQNGPDSLRSSLATLTHIAAILHKCNACEAQQASACKHSAVFKEHVSRLSMPAELAGHTRTTYGSRHDCPSTVVRGSD